jgi:hypothetical protein
MALVRRSKHVHLASTIPELIFVSPVNPVARRVHTGQVTVLLANQHSTSIQTTLLVSA